MGLYYVNKNAQPNGDHEVHVSTCKDYLPKPENRIELGYFDDCKGAVKKAREHYGQVNGCKYCCNSCHTQ